MLVIDPILLGLTWNNSN